ncbi:uncharacterized protein LOC119963557 isoform X2 [Scyliorhinus canicula]|uniref:uncharacterized protein LOC119963557 isoform X2 n=1 Tax=Scyliorhinus canicula TaxID=7830 RepID=UPI0018F78B3D|nr:uncharacterized protein LOC119963557 isoform X2 [Scyliorhinus canicula]
MNHWGSGRELGSFYSPFINKLHKKMKAVILLPCLMATVFASPIRKVRDLGSNSHENYYRYYQQFYPNMYNRYMPFRPGYPMQPNYPYYPHMPMNPGYPGYYPNYLPNYNYPNYGYIPTYNGFARNSNTQLSKVKEDNNVGEGGLQQYSVISNTRPLSMSSEVSFEDSNSMEDTNFRIPFLDVPYGFPHYGIPGNPDFGVPGDPDFGVSENPDYGVPGDPDDEVPRVPDYGVPRFPDYGVPAVPDNEGPFTPGLDTNSAGVGFDQQKSQDPATEVFDTEEPTSVLPYSDYEQGMDSLGLNGVDDSMIGGSNEGLGQQNTIYDPFGLDVKYDQSWNNEEFSDQQTPNENLDEDDLTQEDETQNNGKNSMDEDPIVLSSDEDTDGTESNLNEEEKDEESNEDHDKINTEVVDVQNEVSDSYTSFASQGAE